MVKKCYDRQNIRTYAKGQLCEKRRQRQRAHTNNPLQIESHLNEYPDVNNAIWGPLHAKCESSIEKGDRHPIESASKLAYNMNIKV